MPPPKKNKLETKEVLKKRKIKIKIGKEKKETGIPNKQCNFYKSF